MRLYQLKNLFLPRKTNLMKIDINETLANMLLAIKGEVSDSWPEVKSTMNEFLNRRKSRFELISEMALKGELSGDALSSRMQDEKQLLEVELHSIAIITKAIAQNAANAALDVFNKAIQTAIGII